MTVPRPQENSPTWGPPATRAELQERERRAPGRTKPHHDKPTNAFIRDFVLFLSRPWRQRPRCGPHHPPQRRPHDLQGAVATLSRPPELCRPVPPALPSAGRAHLAPPPRGRAPTAAQQPRPAARSAMAAAAAGKEEPPGKGGKGPARGICGRHTPPARAQGRAAGPMRAAAAAGSAPTPGRAGVRRRLREGGKKRWRG